MNSQAEINEKASEFLSSLEFLSGTMNDIRNRINDLPFALGLAVVVKMMDEAPELFRAVMAAK